MTISGTQRLAIRKLSADVGLPCKPGEEGEALQRVLDRLADLAATAGGEPPLPARPSSALVDSLRAASGNAQMRDAYDAREELLRQFQEWSKDKAEIAARLPRWKGLEQLLRYAQGTEAAARVRPQVEAIRAQRSLLAEPDPVPPLTTELAAALRQALQDARARLEADTRREQAGLEALAEWQQLAPADRQSILIEAGLGAVPPLQLGTDEQLLDALQATPLSSWENRSAALPERAARARQEAGKRMNRRRCGCRCRARPCARRRR